MNQSNILFYLVIVLFGFLGFRLFQLQIIEHSKYEVLAKNNTTRTSILRAPRGVIYDRNDEILATSKQTLSVIVYPAVLRENSDKARVARLLANFLNIDQTDLLEIFMKMETSTPLPITLDTNITIDQAIKIFENSSALLGIAVERQATRYYPLGEMTAHVIGYVGQVNNEELKDRQDEGLGLNDTVGKSGLEKVYDKTLRGVNGEARVFVDRYGKSLEEDKRTVQEAIKGQDLHLTIDADMQRVAYEALSNYEGGAAVALNPQTGELYTFVSLPSFDPNIFTHPVPSYIYNDLLRRKAFVNRALSGFTPGSIWKPVTALAALKHNVIDPKEKLHVSGAIFYGGFRFGDWTSKTGMMDMQEALAWSRDTYFYQIARRMKPEWIADMGRSLGAGSKTGIEIEGESSGIVPDPEWKLKYTKEPWYPGNTLHFSIGQSFLLVTPVQAALMIASIANDGRKPSLHLLRQTKKKITPLKNSPEIFQVVKSGLEACVNGGTGGASKFANYKLAGKTGSAEVKGYKHSTHGWFVAYGPTENPEIAVAVFAEGAGHGGSVAAPVAKKIFEVYFLKKEKKFNREEYFKPVSTSVPK